MKGKILGFDPAKGTGAISAEDGTRYSFAMEELHGQAKEGSAVDFEAEGSMAKGIYVTQNQLMELSVDGKEKGFLAAFITFILGPLGYLIALILFAKQNPVTALIGAAIYFFVLIGAYVFMLIPVIGWIFGWLAVAACWIYYTLQAYKKATV